MRNVRIVKHNMCYKVTTCDKSDGLLLRVKKLVQVMQTNWCIYVNAKSLWNAGISVFSN